MSMQTLFDVRHPFFLPLWRRVALVAISLGWAVMELALGNLLWGLVFGAIGAWCGYQFFVVFDPADYKPENGDS